MFSHKVTRLSLLVEPYLIYPSNDDDFKGTIYLPLKDDAPDNVKEAYETLQRIYKQVKEKGFAV